ncbi:hypothetical protein [Bradyrhizobium sp. SZCCHNS3053]|uniref:hypothetical protein n=1 Tax=Bradyrhizobium sp. SZCCHNS3053 TaxID=3057322 RepID=UPI002916BCAE|nr:hypothetical protein [Bradyrhizobium sp. SZCCHNS3053]
MSTLLPPGHKSALVLVSVTKLALKGEMPAAMRLEFLDHLSKMCDGLITDQAIALVEPMDERGWEIVSEAMKLGPKKALDVYADKFHVFAALNPSLHLAAEWPAKKYGAQS